MYWYPQQGYNGTWSLHSMTMELERILHILEQQEKVNQEIFTLVRENHRLLTLIYSREFGTYPPQWG